MFQPDAATSKALFASCVAADETELEEAFETEVGVRASKGYKLRGIDTKPVVVTDAIESAS
jgi:hypothetical protein